MKRLIILAVTAVFIVAGNSCSIKNSNKSKQDTATQAEVKVTQATLEVQGKCEMCKTRIEETAKKVEGVTEASWDAETKKLSYGYDAEKTSPQAVSKLIARAGHDTELDKADDDVYNALPGCCKYRQ
jgi:Cu(I)/Ag(I) efflux system membrane fusion protein